MRPFTPRFTNAQGDLIAKTYTPKIEDSDPDEDETSSRTDSGETELDESWTSDFVKMPIENMFNYESSDESSSEEQAHETSSKGYRPIKRGARKRVVKELSSDFESMIYEPFVSTNDPSADESPVEPSSDSEAEAHWHNEEEI